MISPLQAFEVIRDCLLWMLPGKGAAYMIGFTDADGEPFSGGTDYRLNLPADIPAANFWSLTLYEAENASGLAQRSPLPLARLPRKTCAERARQHRPLPGPQTARR